jgi:hypothetical protein
MVQLIRIQLFVHHKIELEFRLDFDLFFPVGHKFFSENFQLFQTTGLLIHFVDYHFFEVPPHNIQ